MATSSFSKKFVVKGSQAANFISSDVKPRKVTTVDRDYDADRKKGLQLLKLQFTNSKT